jgi:ankyrin repeat protein
VLFGREGATRLLLDEGAAIDANEKGSHPPLGIAAVHGKEALAALLLERGANPNREGAGGMTPLHLVAKGIPLGFLMLGEDSEMIAEERRARVAIARRLLAAGADKAAKNDEGLTPHDIAVRDKEPAVAKLLSP